jgi:hypothetical protein
VLQAQQPTRPEKEAFSFLLEYKSVNVLEFVSCHILASGENERPVVSFYQDQDSLDEYVLILTVLSDASTT